MAGQDKKPGSRDLIQRLKEMWGLLQREWAEKWDRTLPFADYLVDRWEKAAILGFGKGSTVYDSSLVIGDVRVGENTWVGPFTILDGSGGLEIGSSCTISAGVQIYSHDNIKKTVTGGVEPIEHSSTRIGDRCYIGPNTTIVKGVTIGDGCIIGANSLVLEDIASGSIAHGTPCRVVDSTEKFLGFQEKH